MIFSQRNVEPNTQVWDVEGLVKLAQVKGIDTATGEVLCYHQPLLINAAGTDAETFSVWFRSIYPIYGGYARPCLFHCYGRLP